jgi:hypothetical protein
MSELASAEDALAFVREHGVVLLAAKGPAPRLTEAIIGAPIKGSWWAHPRSHFIFRMLNAVTASSDVLACRMIDGKVTLVHRRLWPALVRLSDRFPAERLAQVHEEHTPSGRHIRRDVPFPQWVPGDIAKAARAMTEQDALAAWGAWSASPISAPERGRGACRRKPLAC